MILVCFVHLSHWEPLMGVVVLCHFLAVGPFNMFHYFDFFLVSFLFVLSESIVQKVYKNYYTEEFTYVHYLQKFTLSLTHYSLLFIPLHNPVVPMITPHLLAMLLLCVQCSSKLINSFLYIN